MALNQPIGNTNNISFGPGVIKLGAWQDTNPDPPTSFTGDITPTTDIGFIGEDGITIELTSDKRNIVQGNPQIVTYSFATAQSAMINFTSIEWDFDNFVFALGAGATTNSSSFGTFAFGGNPLNTEAAIFIEHKMASSGNTLNIYAWKVQSESGFSIPLTATEEHQFEFSFQVLNSTHDWQGNALPPEEGLIRLQRVY
tara:strand:+ start:10224 stop:10817 length:594 start_codon:yes stop_codon:yes gene_type:complete